MGPMDAPTAVGFTPSVPASMRARLNYYVSPHLGVLAPKGWHCFGLYGSNGFILLVTPEIHSGSDLLRAGAGLRGSAVAFSRSFGGTSGRFQVAKVAARIFPEARSFVQGVIDEGIFPKEEFPSGPYPNDQLTRLSKTVVEYVTPANGEGLGTDSRIAMNADPISGVAILLPAEDMDLVKLDVRLPAEMRNLARTIIKSVETNHGTPPLNPRE